LTPAGFAQDGIFAFSEESGSLISWRTMPTAYRAQRISSSVNHLLGSVGLPWEAQNKTGPKPGFA